MDIQLLQKYLQNDCTPDELCTVFSYLATEAGQRQLQDMLDKDLDNLQPLALASEERERVQQLFNLIQARKTTDENVKLAENKWGWFKQQWGWMVAAMVSLLLLTLGAWWLNQSNKTDEYLTERTNYGQQRRIVLPDESIITLNGNTLIRYPKEWSTNTPREVWVEGEAFFEVIHTKNHQPFRVHLPDQMNVEVLGTRFNVYTRQSATKVVLNEGKIQLHTINNPDNYLEMKPGEMFFADNQNKIFYKKAVDAQAQSSWRMDRLVFDGTTLAEIATLLQDTYGLTVDINDPKLSQQKFSGSIPSKNAATILKGLAGLFNLSITQKDNHVLIEKIQTL